MNFLLEGQEKGGLLGEIKLKNIVQTGQLMRIILRPRKTKLLVFLKTFDNGANGKMLHIETASDVDDGEMVAISGTFLTKVFEGPYKDAGKWYKQMDEFVKSKGKEPQKIYSYYTTCPKCAKTYGKNYTVLVAKVG